MVPTWTWAPEASTTSSSVAGGAAVPWLLEAGSSLSLEGQAQRPNAEALESIFYGVKYGKASR